VPTLYRRLLGGAFDTLPAVLRCFHEQEAGGSARLVFHVSHGDAWLCRAAAKIARLPEPGAEVRGCLRVVVEGERERWVREMDGRRIETLQWHADGRLVEATGLLRLGFEVTGDADGLRFRSVRGWLGGLPLLPPLLPKVTASIVGQRAGWWVTVRVELPVLGLLMQYEGEAIPE
jgi:hypothetical protein